MHSFSKKQALRFGWNALMARPWIFIGATALIMVISMILNAIMKGSDGLLGFIIMLVGTIVQWWLYLGFTRMTLAAYEGGTVRFDMLIGESKTTLLQYVIMTIITGVLVCVGLVLLVVPGIMVYTMLCLSPFLILERKMDAFAALKESRRLTKGHRMNIFLFVIALAIINIIGVLLVGIGLLITIPVSLLAFTFVYKEIEKGVMPVVAASTPVAVSPAAPTTSSATPVPPEEPAA
jgi:hypothetical protein